MNVVRSESNLKMIDLDGKHNIFEMDGMIRME
jgi:hypothetical protein